MQVASVDVDKSVQRRGTGTGMQARVPDSWDESWAATATAAAAAAEAAAQQARLEGGTEAGKDPDFYS